MINGRWEEAIAVQAHHQSHFGFILLRRQMRFREAFQMAGIDDPRHDAPEWLRESMSEHKIGSTADEESSAVRPGSRAGTARVG